MTEKAVWFPCLRLQQNSIERAMDLTDSFTWEDLPTTDAHTGHLTAAGWIPLTMKYSRSAAIAILCFHFVQSTIRIVTNHETIFIVWYPFDWTVSPFYELVNISQVTLSINDFSSISSYNILNLVGLFETNFSPSYFLPFFRSVFFYYFSTMLSNESALVIADNEKLEKILIRSSWSIRDCEGEFVFRTGKKIEKFGISNVSAPTKLIPIDCASAVLAVQINGHVPT